ncbi:NAD(P)/FAD-dependent oxidoreductase [Halobacillus sp. B23F22_1]|uniref:NAD(P)/FAD-dependent oxidoreductase n=1 Tax=Halobacillus sp. B23F22_1 TaxID=3459514 RepID=UPI00373F6221
MKDYDITIIGAGLTGLTAARKLQSAGENVLIVDKGRSVGGRLATRRVAEGKADHGAQFFTVRTSELQQEVEQWLKNGWIKHWFGVDYPRYTAIDGMNGLAKHLADGLYVRTHTTVEKWREDDGGFTITAEDSSTWRSKKIIITAPVPQAGALLQKSGLGTEALERITFQPTCVGIFHFEKPTTLPASGHIDNQLPAGVERIVDHFKKGISKDVVVSVYMTADWSTEHYGDSDVLERMKERTGGYLSFDETVSEQLKRWRYAQAAATHSRSYEAVTDTVFAAGDAFLRPNDPSGRTRFESAFISGIDVAGAVMS